jgi:hypothetical protein
MIWMLAVLTFIGGGEPQFQYYKRIFSTEAACQAAAPNYAGPRWDSGHTFWLCTSWNR